MGGDDIDGEVTREFTVPLEAGARVPRARKQLVVLRGAARGARYPVSGVVVLGRGSECEVTLDDEQVSRRHARLKTVGPRTLIEDLGSRNGTKVNGVRIEAPIEICFGDRIELGPRATLLFTHDGPLESAGRESARMATIGRIAAGVSHDFNNLIAASLATIALVEARASATEWQDADALEGLRDLHLILSRASELTKTLSTLGRNTDAREEVDASAICMEVTRLCRRTFGAAYHVECQVPHHLDVWGNRTALHQILLNLCLNARDAMPDGGSIMVRAQPVDEGEEAWAQLEVRDEGEGMDSVVAAQIFEPFYTTKPEGRGSGLGLATVAELVKGMGGTIGVTSAPGRGATFRIRLPRVRADRRVTRRERGTLGATAARPGKVLPGHLLVADDQMALCKSLVRLLATDGHDVVSASNGVEALELLASHLPRAELLLVDLDMPLLGGRGVLEAVREQRDPPVVVVMSGHWDPERAAELLAMGAAAYLTKPFPIVELRELLDALLAKHRAQRALSADCGKRSR